MLWYPLSIILLAAIGAKLISPTRENSVTERFNSLFFARSPTSAVMDLYNKIHWAIFSLPRYFARDGPLYYLYSLISPSHRWRVGQKWLRLDFQLKCNFCADILFLKSTGFVPLWVNLVDFVARSDIHEHNFTTVHTNWVITCGQFLPWWTTRSDTDVSDCRHPIISPVYQSSVY